MPNSFVRLLRRGMISAISIAALLPSTTALAQSSGTVTGQVRDEGGVPVQGATVLLTGTQYSGSVRADGTYRLTAPPGRYAIVARHIGYSSRSDSVTIVAGGSTTQDFTLATGATALEAVTTLGSRGTQRTVLDAPVPIDILPSLEIRSTGRTETAQMIQALAPSFNFPRTTLGDATDNVRPATLRGLSPDQALVLVNGKRRHLSAVVNINGFVGRGSEAVDLNAIPASMIDHIEILRDGAAAQYGSDALAGVVNIVLKTDAPGDFTTQVGEFSTREPVTTAYLHDGKMFYTSADKGFSFGQNGYLFLGGELRDRGFTNRAASDPRQQYFGNQPALEADPNLPIPGGVDFKIGDSYTHDSEGFLNAGTTLSNGIQLYAFGGASRRFGDSFAFWRRPRDDNNVRQLYPNGFLPEEQPRIFDGSGFVGAKGNAAGWQYDLSTGYGRNTFDMNVANSVNVSLGPTSPTNFYAGQMAFGQWTNTLDLFRDLSIGLPTPLHTAAGAEFRVDQYKIAPGDAASIASGTFTIFDSTGAATTRPAPVGSQAYPGFRPIDSGNHSRNNVAGYIDLSDDISTALLVDLAGRVEHYNDFGTTTTGKISTRFEPIKGYAFRGAISSGFRAPSLGQEFFSNTAINFVGTPAVPLEIRTFPVSSVEAKVLNAKPLKPERSVNYSAGIAMEPVSRLAVTVDYYRINIKDRIVLSNNFTGADVVNALTAAGLVGLQGGRYFTNAVDTKTDGLDVIANYGWSFGESSVLHLTAAANGNWTRVTRVDTSTVLGGHSDQLFSRVDRARLEKGNPRNNYVLSGNYRMGRFGIDARSHRYGSVTSFGTTSAGDQTWSPKWVSDLALSFGPVGRGTVTLGADNISNQYPDPSIPGNTNSGILPYSGIAPFGIDGRFIYGKVTFGI